MTTNDLGFRPVILNILNRWSGLKMMVDQQMGGHLSAAKALYLVEYVHQVFCGNKNLEEEDLEDLFTEYMDEQCNTILEDDSPIEVSRALVRLFRIYTTEGLEAAEAELRTLPPVSEWLDVVPVTPLKKRESDSSDSEESDDGHMEEDPEWTKVTYGRRR